MIDCHCHLNDSVFDKDRDEIVKNAENIIIIDSGTDYLSCKKSLEISKQYENVFSCLGLDPCLAEKDNFEKEAEKVINLIRKESKNIVGIGEVGLDFLRVKKNRGLQEKVFRDFIKLAKELEKPLIIHSRWAAKRVVEILIEENAEKVILHAFGGNIQDLEKAIESNFMISITTNTSDHTKKIIKNTPIKNLVSETDSPMMWKGRNEPKNVVFVADNISEIKEISKKRVVRSLTSNAKNIFNV